MDAIAAGSGVSKATIYSTGQTRNDLCMEVLVHIHELDEGRRFDTGDLESDIESFLLHEPNPRKLICKND